MPSPKERRPRGNGTADTRSRTRPIGPDGGEQCEKLNEVHVWSPQRNTYVGHHDVASTTGSRSWKKAVAVRLTATPPCPSRSRPAMITSSVNPNINHAYRQTGRRRTWHCAVTTIRAGDVRMDPSAVTYISRERPHAEPSVLTAFAFAPGLLADRAAAISHYTAVGHLIQNIPCCNAPQPTL
eukprot:gene3282-3791_t